MSNPPPPDPQSGQWGQPPTQQQGQYGQQPQQYGQQPAPQGQWGQQPAPQGQWGPQPPQVPAMPYAPQVAVNPFDDESTPILVTGILSLVLCGPIGIYAWMKGNDLRDRAQGAGWPEPSTAKIGRILGIVGTIIFCVSIVLVILYVVFVVVLFGAAATTAT